MSCYHPMWFTIVPGLSEIDPNTGNGIGGIITNGTMYVGFPR